MCGLLATMFNTYLHKFTNSQNLHNNTAKRTSQHHTYLHMYNMSPTSGWKYCYWKLLFSRAFKGLMLNRAIFRVFWRSLKGILKFKGSQPFSGICANPGIKCTSMVVWIHNNQTGWPNELRVHSLFGRLWDSMVGYWGFTSLQHLRPYQGRYRLVSVRTHGNFIMLPHWEIRPLTPWPDIPLSNIILTLSEPVLALSY